MATRSLLIFVMGRSLRILLECFLVTACKLSLGQGNVFTGVCQLFCSGGGSLYDVTSCLADWSHVPSGSLSLVPCSFQGVGVSVREGRAVRILLECIFVVPNSVNIVRYSRSLVYRTRISFSAKQDPLSPLV